MNREIRLADAAPTPTRYQPSKSGSLLIVQAGGPTPVINATLASIVAESADQNGFHQILGAKSGLAGFARGESIDLGELSSHELTALRNTPGAALGSSRSRLTEEEFEGVERQLRRYSIRSILFIGGNGTMRGAEITGEFAKAAGHPVQVIGIPKTVDNDIPATDRCPGYGSAARYVAQSTRDLATDVRSLPQPVSIFETMGRSAGWLAAAAAVARENPEDAPHLIYLPERPFQMETFLSDVDNVVRRLGWAVVVVSEGLRDSSGQPVFEVADPAQTDAMRRPLTGGVGQYLAERVASRLRIRCRCEKPGLLGRASMHHVSPRDLKDAELVGRAGVRALLDGHDRVMISLRPPGGPDGEFPEACDLVPLSAVAGKDRPIPDAWLTDAPERVNHQFLSYVRPLIGNLLEYGAPLRSAVSAAGAL